MLELYEAAREDERTVTVRVRIPDKDPFSSPVDASPFYGYANHYIVFEGEEDHPFTIAFEHPKPIIGPAALESESHKDMQIVVARFRPDVETGQSYKYVLNIWHREGVRVWDPSGELDPDPDKLER